MNLENKVNNARFNELENKVNKVSFKRTWKTKLTGLILNELGKQS